MVKIVQGDRRPASGRGTATGNAAHVTARSDLPEALRADILKLANNAMEYLQENRVPKNSYDLFAAAMKEHFADGDMPISWRAVPMTPK